MSEIFFFLFIYIYTLGDMGHWSYGEDIIRVKY